MKDVLKKYTESEYASALCGFMIKDEPGANMFDMLSFAEGIFHEAAPDLMFYVNMFPVIADPYQLSGEAGTTVRYRDYLQRWFNNARQLRVLRPLPAVRQRHKRNLV